MSNRVLVTLSLIALSAWGFLLYFAPDHIYWRDSGEFILGATYLDIIHPAGFPLFSQISNALVHLPLGSLTWRVHLFAAFLSIVTMGVLGAIVLRVTKSFLLAILSAVAIFCTPVFIAASLSAEAYLLNGLLTLIFLYLLLSWRISSDARFLICGAFLSGLAVANHVSFILIVLGALPGALMMRPPWKRILVSCLLFGFLGLASYGFIPARALQSPPLNSGSATNTDRFLKQISDARDRALRAPVDESTVLVGKPSGRISQAGSDAIKALSELPKIVALLALVGLIALFVKDTALALSTLGMALGNLLFFSGWDPDPWIPCILMCAFWATYGLGWLIERVHISQKICVPIALVALLSLSLPNSIKRASDLHSFATAEQHGRALLDGVPPGGVLLVEPSWFLVRTLSALEQYRTDVMPIYIPSLLFPSYFAHVELTKDDGTHFSSGNIEKEGDFIPNASEIRNFGRLINFLGPKVPVQLEPVAPLTEPLKSVLSLDGDGRITLRSGESGVAQEFITSRVKFASSASEALLKSSAQLQSDSMNYFESIIGHEADLLVLLGKNKEASELLLALCNSKTRALCSSRTIYNAAVLLKAAGMSCESVSMALELKERGRLTSENPLLVTSEPCGSK